MLLPDAVAAARKAAGRSMVLLRNEGGILPLDPSKKTAVIGPLAKNQRDMLGPWWGAGRDSDAVTVFDGIDEQSPARAMPRVASSQTPSRRRPIPRAAAPMPASPGGGSR